MGSDGRRGQARATIVAGLVVLAAVVTWLASGTLPERAVTAPPVSLRLEPASTAASPLATLEAGATLPDPVPDPLPAPAARAVSALAPEEEHPVAGKVVRAADRSPLTLVAVVAYGGPDSDGRESVLGGTWVSANGDFRFEPPATTSATKSLRLTWYETSWESITDAHYRSTTGRSVFRIVTLPDEPGLRDELVLELDTGWTLEGSVVDEAGHPVRGARVAWSPDHAAYADKAGRFRMTDIPRVAEPIRMLVTSHRFVTLTQPVSAPDATAPDGPWTAEARFVLSAKPASRRAER
jgi:hypothetical protein